jgi:hypothetical protein
MARTSSMACSLQLTPSSCKERRCLRRLQSHRGNPLPVETSRSTQQWPMASRTSLDRHSLAEVRRETRFYNLPLQMPDSTIVLLRGVQRELVQERRDRGSRRWLNGFANCGLGVFFLQTVPRDKSLHERLGHGRGVVLIIDSEIAAARIVGARFIACRWKLKERMVFANGDGFRRRSDLTDPLARITAIESQSNFDFGVQREIASAFKIISGARGIQLVGALL